MFASICLLALVACAQAANPFGLNLNKNVSTSGISAGAFVAIQYQVAHSSNVDGVGVFAGGPYYCAQNSLLTATTECMSTGFLTNPRSLANQAKSFAADGHLDAIANLAHHKVYLYSGQSDYTVAHQVVQDIETQFEDMGVPQANFKTEFAIDAGHGVPTLNYGVSCSSTESPYLNNCQYDGAGTLLNWIHGPLKGGRNTTAPVASEWKTLSTAQFLPSGATTIGSSLGDNAYVFAPAACQAGAKCSLHIVWHGCSQGESFIGDVFYMNSGYWQWAKNNNIVLLFPQAESNPLLENPIGCFDWWGYTDGNYAFKSGIQMTTVRNMAMYLGAQK